MCNAQTAQELENIFAFNQLYGYVKYFHPSDEATTIDWDKFAIYWSLRKTTPMPKPRMLTHNQSFSIRVVKDSVDARHSA